VKIKCFDTLNDFDIKTKCLQTNETQHYLGKENAQVAGEVRDKSWH